MVRFIEGALCVIYFLVVLTSLHSESRALPTMYVAFEDTWNYKITPHSMPLLNGPTRNHTLPPYNKGEVSTRVFVESSKTVSRNLKILGNSVLTKVPCPLCKLAVALVQKEIKRKTSLEKIKIKFVEVCVTFKIESELICNGIFDVFGPHLYPVFSRLQIGPKEVCSLILGEVCGVVDNPQHEWTVKLPETPKPQASEPALPKDGLPTFKVLHLSDTHYDPEYVVGSPANCDEPLCCRKNSTPRIREILVPAGKWGSYEKCDSPKVFLENMLQNIAEQHPDIDYIIWTGDLPPHDIWNQTKESNLAIIQDTVEQMFQFFPNTPIFPALGNHESIPAGNFAPTWVREPDLSINWLYTQVADHWRRWLPATSTSSVLHGGFYSVLVRPGFRIISLNTNYCHTLSWWLLIDSTDPAQELEWLVYELQQAENKNEKVHLIGHIPPGVQDCMKVWSRNFNAILERYENTVVAQFYGHTHADEFEMFYDMEKSKRPIGVAYLAPSVTSFENNNPAYRLYYVDGDHNNTTREVIDHETWTMSLELANKEDSLPIWYRLYSARNDLGLESLRPKEWNKFIDDMVKDDGLFELFYKFYFRDSPTRPDCDNECKLQIFCDLRSGRSQSRRLLCHDLEISFGK